MRCPYCGNFNPDNTNNCRRCGRNLVASPVPLPNRQQPPVQQPMYPPAQSPMPVQAPPAPVRTQSVPAPTSRRQRVQTSISSPTPIAPTAPPEPEPPAPFPPRTIAQIKQLEQGAQAYTLLDDDVSNKRKRIVRILYARCAGWQQVGTLYKALKEYQSDTFETIVIQGMLEKEANIYGFTNGQLVFDRNVRLGSQVMNRYQIETGNGFESSSVRIVLSE